MRAVLDLGVDMINDILGFQDQSSVDAVLDSNCAVCLMHILGEPRTMQNNPVYQNVIQEVHDFLQKGAHRLRSAGISQDRIVLDPGFGFGKTVEHNYTMLKHLQKVMVADYPSLLGMSRKSMIGAITGKPASDRLGGSIATVLAGVTKGAHIFRVHDVAQTVDAIKIWAAIEQRG